jgi:DNA invertase Pin-like site-specific DNA recombinase
MLQEYAKKHGYEIVATFEDVASGLKDDRRGLKKVFEALRAGQADVIVVAWKDRLSGLDPGIWKTTPRIWGRGSRS